MKNIAISLLALVVTFLLLELVLVFKYNVIEGGLRRGAFPYWVAPDSTLMWKPKAHADFEYEVKDGDGSFYSVHYRTNEVGSRLWGDPQTTKKKVLIIGDSHTHAMFASNDETYYKVLQEQLGVEIFAFGVSAYNTVQEWLALKRLLPQVEPDLILWQYCDNDTGSNAAEDELPIGFIHNPNGKIPYYDLEQQRIVYLPQNPILLFAADLAVRNPSKFMVFVGRRILKFWVHDEHRHDFLPDGESTAGSEATKALFAKIAKEIGDVPLALFSNVEDPSTAKMLEEIAAEHDFIWLSGVDATLKQAEANGKVVRVKDGWHWNRLGNKMVGNILAKKLKTHLAN